MIRKSTIPLIELSAQVDELYNVLQKESDLGCVLIGTTFLNECLGTLLESKFRKNSETVKNMLKLDTGFVGSLTNRINLTYAMELIVKSKFNDLNIIAEIRKLFTRYHLNWSFESSEIIQKCDRLNSYHAAFPSRISNLKNKTENNPGSISAREKFSLTVTIISQELIAIGWGEDFSKNLNTFNIMDKFQN